jgi:hypothetical protein
VDGGKTEDQAKADAAQKAKDKALKKALAAAIKQETSVEVSIDNINLNDAKNGKFQWTNPSTNKTYTFDYNVDRQQFRSDRKRRRLFCQEEHRRSNR